MGKKLLLVFIHGFRGSDTSFKDFPDWLESSLGQTLPGTEVETIIYPRYNTAGELSVAVQNFSSWLLAQKSRHNEDVDVVLLGHSMGGIVGAETILQFHEQGTALSILGLLAYDTPFYSINEGFISRTASSWVQKLDRFLPSMSTSINSGAAIANHLQITAPPTTTSASSSFLQWGLVGSAMGIATLGAYLTRDRILTMMTSTFDHLEFVSALADQDGCHQRMTALLSVSDLIVRCFYVKVKSSNISNTFITMPPNDTMHVFTPIVTTAESEIAAHISIFDPYKNDHYYTLGSDSIALISTMVARRRSCTLHDPCITPAI
ncbi:hypothetical protein [Absidia glauca]|uniref:DUF676 domain-containing protein n=1 Tax=Absidia glauca TaxID=4829 RepID=A0A163LS29_ABSGL|nr:hypothetical protein [Absidia glauca]